MGLVQLFQKKDGTVWLHIGFFVGPFANLAFGIGKPSILTLRYKLGGGNSNIFGVCTPNLGVS